GAFGSVTSARHPQNRLAAAQAMRRGSGGMGTRYRPPGMSSLACGAVYAAPFLPPARECAALYRSFRWQIPALYNIGVDVCDRWAEIDAARTAIFNVRADGKVEEVNYRGLRDASNRVATAPGAR